MTCDKGLFSVTDGARQCVITVSERIMQVACVYRDSGDDIYIIISKLMPVKSAKIEERIKIKIYK